MPKRGNENSQQRREDYEAEDVTPAGNESLGTFARADPSTLKSRRIIRSSRRSTGTATATDQKPQLSLPSSTTAGISNLSGAPSSNPFGSINLTTSNAASSSASSNPFASVSLVGAKTDTAAKTTFSFGSSSAATPSTFSSKPSTPFVFGNSTSASTTTEKTSASNNTSDASSKGFEKALQLDEALRKKIEQVKSDTSEVPNLISVADQYLRLASKFSAIFDSDSDKENPPKSTTSAPAISFGNFGSTSTSGKATSSTVSMSFAAPASTKSPTSNAMATPAPTPVSTAPPSDTSGDNESGAQEELTDAPLSAAKDPHWDNIGEPYGTVLFYHLSDPKNPSGSQWAQFAKGKLQLQKSTKGDGSHRMVMRNEVSGKVIINMKISGTEFKFSEHKTKKGSRGVVLFSGTNEANRGYEGFQIRSLVETGKALHEKLVELAKA